MKRKKWATRNIEKKKKEMDQYNSRIEKNRQTEKQKRNKNINKWKTVSNPVKKYIILGSKIYEIVIKDKMPKM